MKKRTDLIKFFAIAIGFTWLFWVPDGLGKRGLLPDTFWTNLGFPGAWGPLVAALYLVAKEEGIDGIKNFLKKGTDYKFGKGWWAVVLLLLPALIVIAYFISILTEGVVPPSLAEGMYQYLPFIFIIVMFTGGPLEEFGWRDALPRLQSRPPFIHADTGFIWAVWHLLQFLVHMKTGMFYITPIWSFILTIMVTAFVYTWVYSYQWQYSWGTLNAYTDELFLFDFPCYLCSTGYLWVLGLFTIAAVVVVWVD